MLSNGVLAAYWKKHWSQKYTAGCEKLHKRYPELDGLCEAIQNVTTLFLIKEYQHKKLSLAKVYLLRQFSTLANIDVRDSRIAYNWGRTHDLLVIRRGYSRSKLNVILWMEVFPRQWNLICESN